MGDLVGSDGIRLGLSRELIRDHYVVGQKQFVTSLGLAGAANANNTEEDLFSMEELTSGYLTAGGHEGKDDGEGKCGEGKCGEDKKEGEGKCGEGKCGGDS